MLSSVLFCDQPTETQWFPFSHQRNTEKALKFQMLQPEGVWHFSQKKKTQDEARIEIVAD